MKPQGTASGSVDAQSARQRLKEALWGFLTVLIAILAYCVGWWLLEIPG